MSGQDYPIKPVEEIYNFFNARIGWNFLQSSSPGDEWIANTCSKWISQFHLTDYDFRGRHRVEKIINTFLPSRRFPFPYVIYGGQGGAWWTLSGDCARYLVNFMVKNDKFRRYLKHTWGPDEFVPHTLIMNSAFRETTLLNHVWYQDWSTGGNHPKILQLEDFEHLVKSDKLMGRKFDNLVDSNILAKIDSEILYPVNRLV